MNDFKFQIIRGVDGVPSENDFRKDLRHMPFGDPLVVDRQTARVYVRKSNGSIVQIAPGLMGATGPQGPAGPQGPEMDTEKIWPIGSVFYCVPEAPPEKLLGFGKWEVIGKPTKKGQPFSWQRVG